MTEGLGIESYPYCPSTNHNTPSPTDKMSKVITATYAAWMGQASLSRGRVYLRSRRTRRPPPLPPVELEAHGDIPVAVVVQSTTAISPTLEAAVLTVYLRLQLPSTPITAEMLVASLVRTVSWLAASAALRLPIDPRFPPTICALRPPPLPNTPCPLQLPEAQRVVLAGCVPLSPPPPPCETHPHRKSPQRTLGRPNAGLEQQYGTKLGEGEGGDGVVKVRKDINVNKI